MVGGASPIFGDTLLGQQGHFCRDALAHMDIGHEPTGVIGDGVHQPEGLIWLGDGAVGGIMMLHAVQCVSQ